MVCVRPSLTYSKGYVSYTKLFVLEPSALFSVLCDYVTITVIGIILPSCYATVVTVT